MEEDAVSGENLSSKGRYTKKVKRWPEDKKRDKIIEINNMKKEEREKKELEIESIKEKEIRYLDEELTKYKITNDNQRKELNKFYKLFDSKSGRIIKYVLKTLSWI